MIRLSLIYCAFDKHNFGRIQHDATLDKWIRTCKRCRTVVNVDAPQDENGMNYTPVEWLELENQRSEDELTVVLEQFKREHKKL